MSKAKTEVKHSALFNYIAEESQRYIIKGALCIELLLMAAKSLTKVTQDFNGVIRSKKQGGKKGSTEFVTANVVSGGLTNAIDRHFLDVVAEAKALLPALQYDDKTSKANLTVVEIADLGESKYRIDSGSQLRRLRAAFMTLCGDWRPLYENGQHEAVQEFVESFGEVDLETNTNIGFSVAHAIRQLQREDAATHLECVAQAKTEVMSLLSKATKDTTEDTTEGGDNTPDGGGNYSPHVNSLLETVGELKKAIVESAPNMTANEAEAWQDRIAAICTEMTVQGGEEVPVDDAPVIEESTVKVPVKKAKTA